MMTIRRMIWSGGLVASAVVAAGAFTGCSGDEEPQGAADAGREASLESGAAIDGSRDAARRDAADGSDLRAVCRSAVEAEAGVTCVGSCVCDNCPAQAYACLTKPGCAAIVACANETGCDSPASCGQAENCGEVLRDHAIDLLDAVAFADCYNRSCRTLCSPDAEAGAARPDAARDASPDARDSGTEAGAVRAEAGPDATTDASASEAGSEAATEAGGDTGSDTAPADGALLDGALLESAPDGTGLDADLLDGPSEGG